MTRQRFLEPKTRADWAVLAFLIGSAWWGSHVLRSDIPVIAIIEGASK